MKSNTKLNLNLNFSDQDLSRLSLACFKLDKAKLCKIKPILAKLSFFRSESTLPQDTKSTTNKSPSEYNATITNKAGTINRTINSPRKIHNLSLIHI